MFFNKVYALWWDFWLIPYFKVFEVKDNKVVKIFNQRVVNSQHGSEIALLDFSNKIAWWITNDYIVHKARLMFIVDIKNGVPLKIEEVKEISGNLILKEKTIKKVSIDKEKQKTDKKNGLPKTKSEIAYPPSVLFEALEGHFVKDTLSDPPSKWESLAPVLIVALIVAGFLLWQLMNSKVVGA